jgi:hypothetical protein
LLQVAQILPIRLQNADIAMKEDWCVDVLAMA